MSLNKLSVKIMVMSLLLWIPFVGAVSGQVVTSNGVTITASLDGWGKVADTNSQINSFTVNGSGASKYLHLDYDLGNGSWVSIYNDNLSDTQDYSNSFNAFSFYVKTAGVGNNLVLKARTTNEDVYGYTLSTSDFQNQWHKCTIYFSEMYWLYNFNGDNTNQGAELTNHADSIKNLEFTVEPVNGGSGQVTVDELYVIATATPTPSTTPTPTPTPIMIDDAENGLAGTNTLNSSVTDQSGGVIAVETTPVPYAGTYCMSVSSISAGQGVIERMYYNDNTNTPLDASSYNYLSMEVLVTTAVTEEIQVQLHDITESSKPSVVLQDYLVDGSHSLDTNTWKEVRIPLSQFSGVDLSHLGYFLVILPADTKLYFDNLKVAYYEPPAVSAAEQLVDNMDTFYANSSWLAGASAQTSVSAESVTGYKGKAIQFNYEFPNAYGGEYAYLVRGFGLNAMQNNSNAFKFNYRGSNGNNNLEFKVADNDGTTYQFKLDKVTNTSLVWKTLTVSYENMSYVSGLDKTFNFKNIQKIEFVVSKGDGGSGTFDIDQVEYFQKPDFIDLRPSTGIITSFTIDNNPFAPRSGTPKSTATFSYTLSDSAAKVWLKIYDLNGNSVRKLEPAPGANSITWDGHNENGHLVRNGLYLYQFVAQGRSRTDRIKNVIAVIR